MYQIFRLPCSFLLFSLYVPFLLRNRHRKQLFCVSFLMIYGHDCTLICKRKRFSDQKTYSTTKCTNICKITYLFLLPHVESSSSLSESEFRDFFFFFLGSKSSSSLSSSLTGTKNGGGERRRC